MAPSDLCSLSIVFPQLQTLSDSRHVSQQSSNFLRLCCCLLLELSVHRKMQMRIYSPILVLLHNAKCAETLNGPAGSQPNTPTLRIRRATPAGLKNMTCTPPKIAEFSRSRWESNKSSELSWLLPTVGTCRSSMKETSSARSGKKPTPANCDDRTAHHRHNPA